jgi:hypothetical protein
MAESGDEALQFDGVDLEEDNLPLKQQPIEVPVRHSELADASSQTATPAYTLWKSSQRWDKRRRWVSLLINVVEHQNKLVLLSEQSLHVHRQRAEILTSSVVCFGWRTVAVYAK